MMYSAYKLNKQGDNIQPWQIPFSIWNQSVVPCPVLSIASWPAYRFLKSLSLSICKMREFGLEAPQGLFWFILMLHDWQLMRKERGYGSANNFAPFWASNFSSVKWNEGTYFSGLVQRFSEIISLRVAAMHCAFTTHQLLILLIH